MALTNADAVPLACHYEGQPRSLQAAQLIAHAGASAPVQKGETARADVARAVKRFVQRCQVRVLV